MFEGMTQEEILGFAVIWVFLAGLVAWFAQSRGHSAVNAFGTSLLLSPIVGFLIFLFIAPKRDAAPAAATVPAPTPAATLGGRWTQCERCGSPRNGEDRFCSKCGLDYWSVPPG